MSKPEKLLLVGEIKDVEGSEVIRESLWEGDLEINLSKKWGQLGDAHLRQNPDDDSIEIYIEGD